MSKRKPRATSGPQQAEGGHPYPPYHLAFRIPGEGRTWLPWARYDTEGEARERLPRLYETIAPDKPQVRLMHEHGGRVYVVQEWDA